MTTTGTTPGATPFMTGTTSTEVAAKPVTTPTKRIGRATKTAAGAAEIPTVPAQRPGLSTETRMLLEDTVNPATTAARARAPSAATNMAETPGAFRHAEARALVAVAAVAIGNPITINDFGCSVVGKIWKRRKRYAANEAEVREISLGQSS